MKKEEVINKRIEIAEKVVRGLVEEGNLKKISDQLRDNVADFYESKALNRLKTAKPIYEASKEQKEGYTDYSEVVAASYYAMYYIIHTYLAT